MNNKYTAIITNSDGVRVKLLEATDYDSALIETEGYDESTVYIATTTELYNLVEDIRYILK